MMTGDILTDWTSVPVAHESMSVYRACPAGAEPSGTVIVGFEMFGLTRYIRAVTERIATLGYTALAPDFYHRSGDRIDLPATPAGRARGLALLGELDRPGVIDDVRNAIGHLAEPGHTATPAAMVGLSAGGHIAYAVATEIPLCALALFYPGWLTEPGTALGRPESLLDLTPRIAALGTPVLLLVGEDDHLYTSAQLRQIELRLREEQVRHEMIVYPDTPHGFFCHERDTYRPHQADDAFARLTALLDQAMPRPG
jgi:carboxymethylenebutenolidase